MIDLKTTFKQNCLNQFCESKGIRNKENPGHEYRQYICNKRGKKHSRFLESGSPVTKLREDSKCGIFVKAKERDKGYQRDISSAWE